MCTSLSPRPDRLTTMVGSRPSSAVSSGIDLQRAGQRVRALDRRDDPLGAAEQLERGHRLGVGDRLVASPGRCRAARRAPARRPGSPGRPRSSATRSSARPRPAARRYGRRAARPDEPPVMLAACRPVSTPSPPASKPYSRTSGSGTKAWKMPIALEPPPTQAATASGSRAELSPGDCCRASTPMPRTKSRTIAGNGCGPAAVPSR